MNFQKLPNFFKVDFGGKEMGKGRQNNSKRFKTKYSQAKK